MYFKNFLILDLRVHLMNQNEILIIMIIKFYQVNYYILQSNNLIFRLCLHFPFTLFPKIKYFLLILNDKQALAIL